MRHKKEGIFAAGYIKQAVVLFLFACLLWLLPGNANAEVKFLFNGGDNGFVDEPVVYYQNDTVREMSVRVDKNNLPEGTAESNLSVKWQWAPSANAAFTDIPHADNKLERWNQIFIAKFTPRTADGTKYYRAAITVAPVGQAAEITYTRAVKLLVLPGEAPVLRWAAPAQADVNAEWGIANGQTVKLPLTQNTNDVQTQTYLRLTSWNKDKYDFAGWRITDSAGKTLALTQKQFNIGTAYSAETAPGALAEYIRKNHALATWYAEAGVTTDGAYDIQLNLEGCQLRKSLIVTPVFTQKPVMQFMPNLVQMEGGQITRERQSGETHTLTAAPAEHYTFVRWEQSSDGRVWYEIADTPEAKVTLTRDTYYRAIFAKLAFADFQVKNYALMAAGEQWFINLDTALTGNSNISTAVKVAVYEGINAEGKKLGESEITLIPQEDTDQFVETLRVELASRPADPQGNIYITAELPNGEQAAVTYRLKGTLDVTPNELTVNTTAALFCHTAPESYQLAVTGSPAPTGPITYSGSNGSSGRLNSCQVNEDGLITFSRYSYDNASEYLIYMGVDQLFVADAGDGRIAVCRAQFWNGGPAVGFKQDTMRVGKGETKEFDLLLSTRTMQGFRKEYAEVKSSNENIFTASLTSKKMDDIDDLLDCVVINGVNPGEGIVTITMNFTDFKGNSDTQTCQCKVVISDSGIKVTRLNIAPQSIELQAGTTAELAAEFRPQTAEAYLLWQTSAADVAKVDQNGTVTAVAPGKATITVTAVNKQGDTVKADCTVTVAEQVQENEVYNVKVYVPKNTVGENGLFFYAAGDENMPISTVKDTSSNAQYDIYSMPLSEGSYFYRGYDAEGKSLGGDTFKIPSTLVDMYLSTPDNTEIYLRKVEAYILNESADKSTAKPEDFTVEMSCDRGAATIGDPYINDDGYYCYPVLAYASGNVYVSTVYFIPSDEYALVNRVAAATALGGVTVTPEATVQKIKTTLPGTREFIINAEAGAEVALYNQLKNYKYERIDYIDTKPQADGTVDYIFNTSIGNNMSYRVSKPGKRTQTAYFSNDFQSGMELPYRVVVKFGDGSPKTEAVGGNSVGEGSVLLNLNERNRLSLKVGEQFNLRCYRAAWQIVNNLSSNIMIEPDYHYNILLGSDVIDLAPITNGNAKDNYAVVTAKKPGVAIVEVSYDALELSRPGGVKEFFGATHPNRTGVFVVTVGEQYADLGILDWDAEYDEVYFTGEQGFLELMTTTANAEVAVACIADGKLNEWQTVAGDKNNFTVPIKSASNVLRISENGKTDYRIVRGSKVQTVVSIEGAKDRTEVYPGDTINIKLTGIYHPMPKFSGIYNPARFYMTYCMGDVNIGTQTSQYDLIAFPLTVKVPENATGSITLTNGKITGQVLGSSWGAHRGVTNRGVDPNFNAVSRTQKYIYLPDLTIPIASVAGAAKPAAGEAGADVQPGDGVGINKTHTESYYQTEGLSFDMGGGRVDGYVTVSFVDYGQRSQQSNFNTPLGVLIAPTKVPYTQGDSIAKVTERLLDALNIDCKYTGTIENGFYLSALADFKLSDAADVASFGEFSAGSESGWMITQNNWFINSSASDFKVEDGDSIKWQYTCRFGADIGAGWDNPSAAITGLKFATPGMLSPEFSRDVKNYTFTVARDCRQLAFEAEQANYWSKLSCTVDGKQYKPMQNIPVRNGMVIKLKSIYTESTGAKPADTDAVNITVRVAG